RALRPPVRPAGRDAGIVRAVPVDPARRGGQRRAAEDAPDDAGAGHRRGGRDPGHTNGGPFAGPPPTRPKRGCPPPAPATRGEGHWLMEEAPDVTIKAVQEFLAK